MGSAGTYEDGRPAPARLGQDQRTRRQLYPVAVDWGRLDPALPLRRNGFRRLAATGLPRVTVLPAKHFLQEDQAPQVAGIVAANVAHAG